MAPLIVYGKVKALIAESYDVAKSFDNALEDFEFSRSEREVNKAYAALYKFAWHAISAVEFVSEMPTDDAEDLDLWIRGNEDVKYFLVM